MKLLYYRDPNQNFGDDLNPPLWSEVLPAGVLDDDASARFVGIGTLLGPRIPAAPTKWVMGSGAGYGAFPVLDDRWKIFCVRGPMTARALGLDDSYAATDPGALVHRDAALSGMSRDGVSFMPHHGSAPRFDWAALCERAGLRYVDPRGTIAETLRAIASSRMVIAEAMHGAIVADALRIPWVPVACYHHILAFKWQDWTASVGTTYRPVALPALWDVERGLSAGRRTRNQVKRLLRSAGFGQQRWARIPGRSSSSRSIDRAARMLSDLAKKRPSQLSTDVDFERALDKVENAIDRFLTAIDREPRRQAISLLDSDRRQS